MDESIPRKSAMDSQSEPEAGAVSAVLPVKPATTSGPIELDVDRSRFLRKLFLILISMESACVLGDIFINYSKWIGISSIERIFNMTREDSIANFLASGQMLLVSMTVLLLYAVIRQTDTGSWHKFSFMLMGIFFFYMAFDDGAKLHERLATGIKQLAEDSILFEAYPSYPWQVVFGPLYGAGALLLLYMFFRGLSSRTSRKLLLLGLTLWVVAVSLDVLEGIPKYGPEGWLEFLSDGYAYPVRHFQKVTEEFIEMVGTSCIFIAFLRELMTVAPDLRFRFR